MNKMLLTLLFVSYLNLQAQKPSEEFNFDGTLNNNSNTASFIGAANFVTDRNGKLAGAQRLENKYIEVVLNNLPQGNKARTVSIWIKFNDISNPNYIWGYGTTHNAEYCGLLQQATDSVNSDLSLAGWGASNDVIVSTSLLQNIWYNYSITFDGKISKIYRNGELLKSAEGIVRNTKGNVFKIGQIQNITAINADIDDLKIYDVALTEQQIIDLYIFSKPAVVVAQAQIIATPETGVAINNNNVANANIAKSLTTNNDVNKSLKSVEVYSQGQRVLGSSSQQELNVRDLPEGTYLLKVTNLSSQKVTSN